jgi:hypothetical protein
MSESVKTYLYNRSFVTFYLVTALLSLAGAVCVLAMGGRMIGIGGAGVCSLIVYFTYRKYAVLHLGQTHMEIQAAPLRVKTCLPYTDVSRVERVKNKLFICPRNGKAIALSLTAFNKDEREGILSEIERRRVAAGDA